MFAAKIQMLSKLFIINHLAKDYTTVCVWGEHAYCFYSRLFNLFPLSATFVTRQFVLKTTLMIAMRSFNIVH